MSRHELATQLQALAAFCSALPKELAPGEAYLGFQTQLKSIERLFVVSYDGLSDDLKRGLREILQEFQAAKESEFLGAPRAFAKRIEGLDLPEKDRTTTEDLLREHTPNLSPNVGGAMRVPALATPTLKDNSRLQMIVAIVLGVLALTLAVIFFLNREEREIVVNDDDKKRQQAKEGETPVQPQTATIPRASFRDAANLRPRFDGALRASTFERMDFIAQLEALEASFSRSPTGVDRLEALLKSASSNKARWRRSEDEDALAAFLMREGNLTHYLKSDALLPSEVFASLGAEETPLGVTLFYLAGRLGLESDVFVRARRRNGFVSAPKIRSGEIFFESSKHLPNQEERRFVEVRKAFFVALIEREIQVLNPELDQLLRASAFIFSRPEQEAHRLALQRVLISRLGVLSAIEQDFAEVTFSKIDPASFNDEELALVALSMTSSPTLSWLEAMHKRGVIVTLSRGKSSLEALATLLMSKTPRDQGRLETLWKAAAAANPDCANRAIKALSELGIEDARRVLWTHLAGLPNAPALAMRAYLVLLAEDGDEIQLLAAVLDVLERPALLPEMRDAAQHGLAIAVSHRLATEGESILAKAEYAWPGDPVFERLSAELAFALGQDQQGRAILTRYLKRWPKDEHARARLKEMASLFED